MGTSSSYDGPSGNKPPKPDWLGPEDNSPDQNPEDCPQDDKAEDRSPGEEQEDCPSDVQQDNGDSGEKVKITPEVTPADSIDSPAEIEGIDIIPSGGDSSKKSKTEDDDNNQETSDEIEDVEQTESVSEQNSQRFTGPRRNFSKFARSNGSNRRALGKSVSEYVSRSLGGSKVATQRMVRSIKVATDLVEFFNAINSNDAEKISNIGDINLLIGKNVSEALLEFEEHFCPADGSIDASIARDAYDEMIINIFDSEITNVGEVSEEQLIFMIKKFITHSIKGRLLNDIGANSIRMPSNVKDAHNLQIQLFDFIQGGVNDALAKMNDSSSFFTNTNVNGAITEVYTESYEFLISIAENEAENE